MIRDVPGIGMTSQRTRGRLLNQLRELGIASKPVLDVIGRVPRHVFVQEALASRAYENTALPIGHGQTISQPYTVARMTELILEGGEPRSVLEVGSGCGYQTAVLSCLVNKVYAIERIGHLKTEAEQRLRSLGARNVFFRHGDGFKGWMERAPFDAILVAAAPTDVPDPLLKQLAVGGRMVIPVGDDAGQKLLLIKRTGTHQYQRDVVEGARFVPFVGGIL